MFERFNLPLQQALRAIDANLERARDTQQPLEALTIRNLIALAIEHGAPIYNRGRHRDCACIYHHLAQGLLGLLPPHQDADCGDFDAPLRQFVDNQLRPLLETHLSVPAAEPAADNIAWDLRRAFDNIGIVAEGLAEVFMIVDMAVESIRASDSEINADIIGGLIALSIHYGARIYNIGSRKGCAAIYLYTATQIDKLLPEEQEMDIQQLARTQLHPLVAHNPCVAATEQAANQLAWKLRHAFDAILEQIEAAAEQKQDQEIATPLETQKVAGLKHWAGGVEVATVAIVFTDIVDSTVLNCKYGDLEWMRMVSTHIRRGESLIQSEHGYLIKTIGDSLMAVFHSASHALNFAMALESDTSHNKINIRAGIHVGPVMISSHDTIGQAVCMAARVQSYVKEGGICISDSVRHEISALGPGKYSHMAWEKHPDEKLKGFEDTLFTLWTVPPTKPPVKFSESSA